MDGQSTPLRCHPGDPQVYLDLSEDRTQFLHSCIPNLQFLKVSTQSGLNPGADPEYDPHRVAVEASHMFPRNLLGSFSHDVFNVKPLLHSFARILYSWPMWIWASSLTSLSFMVPTYTTQIKTDAYYSFSTIANIKISENCFSSLSWQQNVTSWLLCLISDDGITREAGSEQSLQWLDSISTCPDSPILDLKLLTSKAYLQVPHTNIYQCCEMLIGHICP